MTNRYMIDIETIGLEPGAAIISIGAVKFDRTGLGRSFFRSINPQSCQAAGLEIEAGTLEWWLDQDETARKQLRGGDDLEAVLDDFRDWLLDCDEVWANSPSFDCEMLDIAFDAVGLEEPWSFQDERDYRTLTSLVDVDVQLDGTDHHALDDAKHQATVAARALNELEGNDA